MINDGSTDNTADVIKQKNVVTIYHPHNIGYGRSLKDGIKIAKHDTIIITDADQTYPIDQIPALLAEYSKGFDMVVGERTGIHYRGSIIKALLRPILRFIVQNQNIVAVAIIILLAYLSIKFRKRKFLSIALGLLAVFILYRFVVSILFTSFSNGFSNC